jgi:hypothetical protein
MRKSSSLKNATEIKHCLLKEVYETHRKTTWTKGNLNSTGLAISASRSRYSNRQH